MQVDTLFYHIFHGLLVCSYYSSACECLSPNLTRVVVCENFFYLMLVVQHCVLIATDKFNC